MFLFKISYHIFISVRYILTVSTAMSSWDVSDMFCIILWQEVKQVPEPEPRAGIQFRFRFLLGENDTVPEVPGSGSATLAVSLYPWCSLFSLSIRGNSPLLNLFLCTFSAAIIILPVFKNPFFLSFFHVPLPELFLTSKCEKQSRMWMSGTM